LCGSHVRTATSDAKPGGPAWGCDGDRKPRKARRPQNSRLASPTHEGQFGANPESPCVGSPAPVNLEPTEKAGAEILGRAAPGGPEQRPGPGHRSGRAESRQPRSPPSHEPTGNSPTAAGHGANASCPGEGPGDPYKIKTLLKSHPRPRSVKGGFPGGAGPAPRRKGERVAKAWSSKSRSAASETWRKNTMWRKPPRVRPVRSEVGLSRVPRTGGGVPPGVRASVLGSTGLSGYPRTAGDVPTDVRAPVVGLSASQGLHARAAAAARRQSPGLRRDDDRRRRRRSA